MLIKFKLIINFNKIATITVSLINAAWLSSVAQIIAGNPVINVTGIEMAVRIFFLEYLNKKISNLIYFNFFLS